MTVSKILLILDCFLVSNMFSLVGETAFPATLPPSLSDEVLHSRSSPGIHHVSPVLGSPGWELLEPLDQQHTGVTDVASPGFRQAETFLEKLLVFTAPSKPGAARLGFTDAAASAGSVD